MNPAIDQLHPYPFEKLNQLKAGIQPPSEKPPIALSIGEPKHAPPAFALDILTRNLDKAALYASTRGLPELREAIADWLSKRFSIDRACVSPEHNILPVAGTREALFSFTQAIIDRNRDALVISPNPFYQVYEGAALLAGAEPHYLACTASNRFVPDFDSVPDEIWRRCQLLFLCSPGNPTGAVTGLDTLEKLILLSDKYQFVIAADECYSEIYTDESRPPVGLLQACVRMGRHDFRNCIVFHSLSKRSNLPGLRSGFVAGDPEIIRPYLSYRTYHGCSLPIHHQLASIACWQDEQHVLENRNAYREKFSRVLEILQPVMNVRQTDASFYLWPETPIDDVEFARALYERENVTVLPGSYLSRDVAGDNPGRRHIRMALVASVAECEEAAHRIARFVTEIQQGKQGDN